jgi:hypothetical protein
MENPGESVYSVPDRKAGPMFWRVTAVRDHGAHEADDR